MVPNEIVAWYAAGAGSLCAYFLWSLHSDVKEHMKQFSEDRILNAETRNTVALLQLHYKETLDEIKADIKEIKADVKGIGK